MNAQQCPKIAIDVPSGMPANSKVSCEDEIFKANTTLTFETPKLNFLFQENFQFCGDFVVLKINWLKDGFQDLLTEYFYTELKDAQQIFHPRKRNVTKHQLGFAQLFVGSHGKAGAAILSAKACLHSGCGLTEVYVPNSLVNMLQSTTPEAMCSVDAHPEFITSFNINKRATAIGIGPGIGLHELTRIALADFLKLNNTRLVLDADALNIISDSKELLKMLSNKAIITPHQLEFDRLFGASQTSTERLQKAIDAAHQYQIVVVLKGIYVAVVLPNGEVHFNSTGNQCLAKGGSGDVLTGIITSLLAQGYSIGDSAKLGVFVHGLAADKAVKNNAYESVLASDICKHIGKAFIDLYN
jgi:NAD(P)H-hydrate epimerase